MVQGHTVYPVPAGIIAKTFLGFYVRIIKSLEGTIKGTLQEMYLLNGWQYLAGWLFHER